MSYSRDATVAAVTKFYNHLLQHPYLDSSCLKTPPPPGWESLQTQVLISRGKNANVIDVLGHLPYLTNNRNDDGVLVQYETMSIDYTNENSAHTVIDDVYPIPSHCVYLTQGKDREGIDLILDTQQGTITAYSISGYHITMDKISYKELATPEKWTAHFTAPVAEFFDAWIRKFETLVWMLVPDPRSTEGRFYSRADREREEDELCERGLVDWNPNTEIEYTGDDMMDDEVNRQGRRLRLTHLVKIYHTHLERGWASPQGFDKQRCVDDLIELEQEHDVEENRLMDMVED